MLTDAQRKLIGMARSQAALPDADYRDILHMAAGVTTSKDSTLGDEGADKILKALEAEYWKRVDADLLIHAPRHYSPFRARGYWAGKNRPDRTSRDRYTDAQLSQDILAAEDRVRLLGRGDDYLAAIWRAVSPAGSARSVTVLHAYLAALRRTLKSSGSSS
jgi:hypothetical protein